MWEPGHLGSLQVPNRPEQRKAPAAGEVAQAGERRDSPAPQSFQSPGCSLPSRPPSLPACPCSASSSPTSSGSRTATTTPTAGSATPSWPPKTQPGSCATVRPAPGGRPRALSCLPLRALLRCCVAFSSADLFHWACLNEMAGQLPKNTAPAGYQCPSCKGPIFPPANLVSPVASALREKLATVNWARAGLGLPLVRGIAGSLFCLWKEG